MNRAFIRRLARHMRRIRHEKHYDQATFGEKTACGTAACIAGHAVTLGGYRLLYNDEAECKKGKEVLSVSDAAEDLMGLDSRQGGLLFSGDPDWYWPEGFGERWSNSYTSKERPSRIAADLLDAIADGKVKL